MAGRVCDWEDMHEFTIESGLRHAHEWNHETPLADEARDG